MLPAAARTEHRAASVGEQGMKARLYAADTISSGTKRTREFICAWTCLRVQRLPSTMQRAVHMTSATERRMSLFFLLIFGHLRDIALKMMFSQDLKK